MKQRSAMLYILMALVIAAIIWLLFLLAPSADIDTVPVILPAESEDAGETGLQPGESDESHAIAVTTDSVQAVIRTLSRAPNYSRTLTVESFWTGGKSSRSIAVWARGDAVKMVVSEGDSTASKNILIDGDEKWIWYTGSDEVFYGYAAKAEADEYQTLLSYEEVLALDSSAITDAGYIRLEEEMCIYVRYTAGEFGYDNVCYVSVESGLLMGSEIFDGDTLIYRMSSTPPDISTPDDSVFTRP